jgi:6-methylsalicylate decarboxylase
MIIDVHAHSMATDYLKRVKKMGGSYQDRFTGHQDRVDLDARLEMMKEAGVSCQILSPTCPPYSVVCDLAVGAARLINNYLAKLERDHPSRFGFWVSLPLPHVREALAELRRGLDELGGRGIVLGCFCLDQSIASEVFDPIYEELDRRGSVVFLHPCQNGIHSPQVNEWGLTVCAGASLEDSLSVLQLISRRVPSRFPRISEGSCQCSLSGLMDRCLQPALTSLRA